MKNRSLLLVLVVGLFLPSLAQAGLYLRPRVGATIPLHPGHTSASLGLAAGYQWTDFLATEVSYSHLMASGNTKAGDIIRAEGIVSLPLPVVTPYVSAGFGEEHIPNVLGKQWNSMLLVGGGISLKPLGPLQLGAGITYAAVRNGPDFVEPYVSVGIGF